MVTTTHNEQPTERASKCKQCAGKCRQVQAKCRQSVSLHTLRKSLIISSENAKSARCKHFSQKQTGWDYQGAAGTKAHFGHGGVQCANIQILLFGKLVNPLTKNSINGSCLLNPPTRYSCSVKLFVYLCKTRHSHTGHSATTNQT